MSPAAGRDYPGSYAELRAWFDQDWKCLDYLDWIRWPDGLICPGCGGSHGWRLSDARWLCGTCKRKVSATAGTIFDKTRTPLTVWFTAAWLVVNSRDRRLGHPASAGDGAGLLPERVGDASPLPDGDGGPGPGPIARGRRGRRELPWRPGAGRARPWRSREGSVRGRRGGHRGPDRPCPPGCHPRRQRGQPGRVPGREPRAGQPGSSPTAGLPTRRRPASATHTRAPRLPPPACTRTRFSRLCTWSSPWSSAG